jgi:hypothetical protein
MRPFRGHRRFTWVALIALVAQLILSFGHVHAYRHTVDACSNLLSSASDDHSASGDSEDGTASCALCWLARTAGMLVLSELVSHPILITLSDLPPLTPSLAIPVSARSCVFAARAPPAANV